ncbi:uncharacterized protein LOC131658853 [Vicia villosa]|uniref:uncharacterized protein LOC131658853 n=1 Tax=Vicia villosa TaxID=3911 RepID=UPI00273C4DF6|nr:uncharacterized protein LOC131658853 [Vicia villosa]
MGHKINSLECVDIGVLRQGSQLNRDQKIFLERGITEDEILVALKGIDDSSAPGLDGYSAKFFKTSWNTIKIEVIAAIHEYFDKGKMYKAFNCSLVSLVPKSASAKSIREFRPISVDLQKAYDMIDWQALECIMDELGIPHKFLKWIMQSLTSVSYRFNINGSHSKMLIARRGIRLGDPISPYLFAMLMEYLQRSLHQMQLSPRFKHHAKCKKLQLTNLMFADDVLLLAKGDVTSVDLLLSTFYKFLNFTGMQINKGKSKIFFRAVTQKMKNSLLTLSGFQEGTMPFKYLGVPITSKKLSIHHYMGLIDKIICRTHIWTSKLLTYAGRLQLIKSISFAIVNYWMLCFPLPKAVLAKIDAICRSFLWTCKDQLSRKSLVAWSTVCQPVNKGGLGVININIWNKCAMLKLLWNICNKPNNLWVKWIHAYYLKQ